MSQAAKKVYFFTVSIVVFIKVILASWLPITSDEAYYVMWGKYLDYGYYDQPPMIGWISNLMWNLDNSTLIVRLPVIIFTLLIGVLIYDLLKQYNQKAAMLVSLIYFVWPGNILNFIVAPSVPLMFFSFLSVYTLFYAEKNQKYSLYMLSGLFLSLAFLSKYFAVFLAIAYIIYFLSVAKKKWRITGFGLLFLSVLPGGLINLVWNYNHNWINIAFYLYSRDTAAGLSIKSFIGYLIMQLYLITPPVIYYAVKKEFKVLKSSFKGKFKLMAFAYCTPLFIFAIFSFKLGIGLHWQLVFYPFFHFLLYNLLSNQELIKSIKFLSIFSLLHVIVIAGILVVPVETFENHPEYETIILGKEHGQVTNKLAKYKQDFFFTTPGYSNSAILGFYFPEKKVGVFGSGHKFGRMYDFIINYERLDKENILIFKEGKPKTKKYRPYFEELKVEQLEVKGAVYYVVLGYQFKYEVYQRQVLEKVYKKYYDYKILDLLPYNKEFKTNFK